MNFFKTFLKFLLKPLAFVPALFMMYMIFQFSAQQGEASASLSLRISREIVSVFNEITNQNWDMDRQDHYVEKIHFYVRKAAHITEYFLLAVSLTLPVYIVFRLRHAWLFLISVFLCFLVACSDEFHQSFVSGRSASARDVLIDGIGIILGVFVTQMFCFAGRKSIFKALDTPKRH